MDPASPVYYYFIIIFRLFRMLTIFPIQLLLSVPSPIPDPLITITNYKPSPNKCSCKTTCSCPHSTPSKAISTRNSPKSLNCSLNHHDFSTNSSPTINYQSNPKPKIDKNVKNSEKNVTKTLKNVTKTDKYVHKNIENPDKHSANSSRNSLTSCKTNPTKPNYKSKNPIGKGRKCSRKLKRLKKLNNSSNNTLNSTNSTQSNSLINTNTINTNNVNLNNVNLNKSIKVKSDKCVERLNILEHLGEAESLLKFERELRFSQIRSDYSLVRDRIEEKFHLVVMCCRKRQVELNSKYIEVISTLILNLSSCILF
ncbi:uncharacterized protein TA07405 [Theileria annulata]|uniref:Uncharacterized protein n=1 Tax=Theileria annulata TaxID=5874 RepID=Q4UA65_THEAN|nr:uncharacterized protein TA07405 [Theileria annulata]CAI76288.1 hypothetical protein TA07405 [Theileria annulata]|eukprot:XP_952912.1 hypothetical protein TA07405 [Theileria annulata]